MIKTIKIAIFLFIVPVLALYGGYRVFLVSQTITKNWKEIKFAVEKLELVKTLREDYEEKQGDLERSFLEKKSREEQLIEEAAKELKQERSKK